MIRCYGKSLKNGGILHNGQLDCIDFSVRRKIVPLAKSNESCKIVEKHNPYSLIITMEEIPCYSYGTKPGNRQR